MNAKLARNPRALLSSQLNNELYVVLVTGASENAGKPGDDIGIGKTAIGSLSVHHYHCRVEEGKAGRVGNPADCDVSFNGNDPLDFPAPGLRLDLRCFSPWAAKSTCHCH